MNRKLVQTKTNAGQEFCAFNNCCRDDPDIDPTCSRCGCDIVHMKVVDYRKTDEDSDALVIEQDDIASKYPDQRTGFFCFYTNRGFCSVCGMSRHGFLETLPFTFK